MAQQQNIVTKSNEKNPEFLFLSGPYYIVVLHLKQLIFTV